MPPVPSKGAEAKCVGRSVRASRQVRRSADVVPTLSPEGRGVKRMKPLLPQPGGFEGFVSVGVHLYSRDEAVPKRPDPSEAHLHLRAAVLSLPTVADDCDQLIPGIEDLLDIERPVFEALDPLCEPLIDFLDPDEGPRNDCASKRRRVPDDVGVDCLGQDLFSPLDVFEDTPEQVEILLRHRLRSISLAWRTAFWRAQSQSERMADP